MPKGKAKSKAFERVRAGSASPKARCEVFARECAAGSVWIKAHMPGHCTQTAATRAFKIVERHMLKIGGR